MASSHDQQEVFHCTQTYRMNSIGVRSRVTPEYFGFARPKPRTITFIVSFKHVHNSWIRSPDSGSLQLLDIDIPTHPSVLSAIELTREQLFCSKLSRRIIRQRTRDWLPHNNFFREFVKKSLEKARKALKSMPEGHDALFVDVPLVLEHDHVFLEGSGRVYHRRDEGMVPASDSSIESLEDRVALDCDGSCVICMEGYDDSNGSCGAVFMPCSHVFHGDCIKKWLTKSHMCPVCRFEMPKKNCV